MADQEPEIVELRLGDAPGRRLDKALAAIVPENLTLSRSRITALILSGAVHTVQGVPLTDPSARPTAGAKIVLTLPLAVPIDAVPQDIPLDIRLEDADVIVVNKPAGMVVHPAPGSPDGTLVNALLHHCGESLRGIGGAQRPGIVHRIDKDTSGLLVVAKSDQAHHSLTTQFAAHSVERAYTAVCWGHPSPADPRLRGLAGVAFAPSGPMTINQPIARHPNDRKKMAVRQGGKHAITHIGIDRPLGDHASQITCRLETGRTHQIRVHMANIGHPLFGDPVYAKNRKLPAQISSDGRVSEFQRQALHAGWLGFEHPNLGTKISLQASLPADMDRLISALIG